MRNIILILLALQTIYVLSSEPDFAIVIARHGARGPTTETYSALSDWGSQHEQLTELGARMHYKLGSKCREKYLHLLEPYDANKVHIRSSEVLRTIESARSFLLGAYDYPEPKLVAILDADTTVPSDDRQEVHDIDPQVSHSFHFFTPSIDIPIETVDAPQDKMLQGTNATCFVSSRWFKDNEESEEAHEFFNVHMKDLIQHLDSKDIHIDGMQGLYEFCDLAIANGFDNITIPGDIKFESQLFFDAMFGSQWIILNRYAGQEIQRQLGGINIFDNVVSTMERVLKGESEIQFAFYATHDMVLAPILAALGVVDKECLLANHIAQKKGEISPHAACLFPIFASDVKFELYKSEEPYVKVFYRDEPVKICEDLEECPLSKFKDYVKKITNGFTVDNYDIICNVSEDF